MTCRFCSMQIVLTDQPAKTPHRCFLNVEILSIHLTQALCRRDQENAFVEGASLLAYKTIALKVRDKIINSIPTEKVEFPQCGMQPPKGRPGRPIADILICMKVQNGDHASVATNLKQ